MIARWFGSGVIPVEESERCFNRGFTGAHIREIHRTSVTMSAKEKKSIQEVFPLAVDIVANHFVTEWKSVGFTANPQKSERA